MKQGITNKQKVVEVAESLSMTGVPFPGIKPFEGLMSYLERKESGVAEEEEVMLNG